jgi:flagellar L-ring protein precursor FlgH
MGKWLMAVIVLVVLASGAQARSKEKKPSPTETDLQAYVQEAKSRQPMAERNPGSLWVDNGTNAYLTYDFKARNIDDIVIIQVAENTNALSSGDASGSRKTSASTKIPKFLGLQGRIHELPNLVDGSSDNNFKGNGEMKRSQTLTTTITARVRDVLPNGNLVIQAVKEVRVDNENQLLTITGVVRPRDISPADVVSSKAIADMQIKLSGKGLVTDHLKPGWLYRILIKVLPF